MADIAISISIDADATMRYFDRMPHRLDQAERGMLEDSTTHFLGEMSRYPAPRPQQSYVRTRTLGRSWSRRPIVKISYGWRAVVGSNGNMAPYNRYVQDRDRQARIHRGRWRTAQTVAEQSTSQIQRFADARIRAALAGG